MVDAEEMRKRLKVFNLKALATELDIHPETLRRFYNRKHNNMSHENMTKLSDYLEMKK